MNRVYSCLLRNATVCYKVLALLAPLLYSSLNPAQMQAITEGKTMTDKERSPVTFRISTKLNANLADAAHKLRISKNEYVITALQEAVNKTLEEKK